MENMHGLQTAGDVHLQTRHGALPVSCSISLRESLIYASAEGSLTRWEIMLGPRRLLLPGWVVRLGHVVLPMSRRS